MSSIYITHEVVGMSDLVAKVPQPDWRTLAISKLQRHGLKIVNPIDWAIPETEEIDRVESRVRRALDLIDQCDAVLANLHRSNYGTAMEIFYAHRRGKMVTVVGHSPFSPWVLTHSRARFEELNRALDFLIQEGLHTDVLNWALQYEAGLSRRYEEYPPAGEKDFQFFGGDLPVLIVAPHASTYFRDGEFLEPDFFPGAVASSLHRLARCHALISNYCLPADPGCYPQTPLVRAIADLVKAGRIGLVLVVVGLNWHEASAAVIEQMGPDEKVAQELACRLRLILSAIDQVNMSEPEDDLKTLMRFIAQTISVPVITLRIHRRFRMPRLQPEAFMHFIGELSSFVSETGTELLRSAG